MSSKSKPEHKQPLQDAINYDPKINRDFVGVVQTNHGPYNMYVPNVQDMMDYEIDLIQFGTNQMEFYKLVAASLRIPFDQLRSWNFNDFMTALNKASDIIGGKSDS